MGARVRPQGGSDKTQASAPRAASLFAPSLAQGDEPPLASPAQTLQTALEAEFAPPARKWRPLTTLAFIVVTCGGFWALAAMVVLHVF